MCVELGKLFQGLELKILRGTGSEVLDYLKKGEVELGIAAGIGEEWERLDGWPLFTEDFQLAVNGTHGFAQRPSVELDELRAGAADGPHLLRDHAESFLDLLRGREFDVTRFHEVSADSDLISLLEAGFRRGVRAAQRAGPGPRRSRRRDRIELDRTVYLYGVAGRQRTAVASAMMKMLRAADWSRYASSS